MGPKLSVLLEPVNPECKGSTILHLAPWVSSASFSLQSYHQRASVAIVGLKQRTWDTPFLLLASLSDSWTGLSLPRTTWPRIVPHCLMARPTKTIFCPFFFKLSRSLFLILFFLGCFLFYFDSLCLVCLVFRFTFPSLVSPIVSTCVFQLLLTFLLFVSCMSACEFFLLLYGHCLLPFVELHLY